MDREIKVGDTIAYKLLEEDGPADPERVWHGVVKYISINTLGQISYLVDCVEIDGEEELVYPFQITGVSSAYAPVEEKPT
jgi:hypothetical protein